jgi:hypothetical protein
MPATWIREAFAMRAGGISLLLSFLTLASMVLHGEPSDRGKAYIPPLIFSPLPTNPPAERPSAAASLLAKIAEADTPANPVGVTVAATNAGKQASSSLAALAKAIASLPPSDCPTNVAAQTGTNAVPIAAKRQRPAKSIAPQSGFSITNGLVQVFVFIDVPFEGVRYPEGTAMLRTKAWLRKAFPELPKEFSVRGRVVENGFDDNDRVYSYRSEYSVEDVKAVCLPEKGNSCEKGKIR